MRQSHRIRYHEDLFWRSSEDSKNFFWEIFWSYEDLALGKIKKENLVTNKI